MLQKSIREGFGLTVSEALWKGRPVVAGRVGGIVSQIRDRETGFLVGSARECADACLEILADPERARHDGAPSARRTCGGASSCRACSATGSRSSTVCSATTRAIPRWPSSVTRREALPPGCPRAAGTVGAMAERRRLIVVSNRGPVTYRPRRGRRPGRPPRRRRPRDRAPESCFASRCDLDRERDDRRGSPGGFRGRPASAVAEIARDGAPYRLRLVAHDPKAYDWYYNVVSNPTLWFIQHYLWGLAQAPDVDQGLHHAWTDGYVAVNRNFADAVAAELEACQDAAVLFHDYHLYVAPALVREQRAGGASRALRSRPLAPARLLARAAGGDPPAATRGAPRERRGQLPHRPLADELPAQLRGHRRSRRAFRVGSGGVRRARGARPGRSDLRRPARVRRARREPAGARRRAADRRRSDRSSSCCG